MEPKKFEDLLQIRSGQLQNINIRQLLLSSVEGEKIFSVQVFFIIPIEQLVENQFCSATCGQVTTQLHPCLSHFQPL